MLNEFLGAHHQASFNQMKEKFEAMPKQLQEGEFNLLPIQTQQVLLNTGYELPSDDRDALWKRMLTWDIPLLPEEHFGKVVAWGMAPIRAVGFVAGKATSTLWEKAVMEPSRFATRLGRTGAYLTQRYGGLASWDPLAGAQMGNPAKRREVWNATKRQNDSFYAGTLEKSIELVGKEQTNLLGSYVADDRQGVYELILNQAQGDEQTAQARFEAWQSTLDNQNSLDALINSSMLLSIFTPPALPLPPAWI